MPPLVLDVRGVKQMLDTSRRFAGGKRHKKTAPEGGLKIVSAHARFEGGVSMSLGQVRVVPVAFLSCQFGEGSLLT